MNCHAFMARKDVSVYFCHTALASKCLSGILDKQAGPIQVPISINDETGARHLQNKEVEHYVCICE